MTMLAVWRVLEDGLLGRGTAGVVGKKSVAGSGTLLVMMVASSSSASTIKLGSGEETVQRPFDVRVAFMIGWPLKRTWAL